MRGRKRFNPLDSGAGDVMGNGFAELNSLSGNLEDRNSWRLQTRHRPLLAVGTLQDPPDWTAAWRAKLLSCRGRGPVLRCQRADDFNQHGEIGATALDG